MGCTCCVCRASTLPLISSCFLPCLCSDLSLTPLLFFLLPYLPLPSLPPLPPLPPPSLASPPPLHRCSLDSFSDALLKFRANVSAAVEEYETNAEDDDAEETVSPLPTIDSAILLFCASFFKSLLFHCHPEIADIFVLVFPFESPLTRWFSTTM